MSNAQNLQLWLLEQLAVYKHLCLSQFKQLGATLSKKTLSRNLLSLRERHLCDQHSYRFHPRYGRLESVHFLLPKGKAFVLKFCGIPEGDIKVQRSKLPIYDQYDHRKRTVSAHIAIRQGFESAGIELEKYANYFEKNGKISATKIKCGSSYIIPDAVFLACKDQNQFLFCLEIHNQYRVKKITNQLKSYVYALAEGGPSRKYDISKSARILVVFEMESTLRSTLESLTQQKLFTHFKDYFLFKEYDDLLSCPGSGRINLRNESVNLFFVSQ